MLFGKNEEIKRLQRELRKKDRIIKKYENNKVQLRSKEDRKAFMKNVVEYGEELKGGRKK